MSVSLSPIYNGYQSFLATGLPNSGGYLYTYAAGTSTPQATFTTSAGNIQNANPMQFNAGGYPPSAIWLTDGQAYKFVITDALGNNVQIFDNIEGSWATGNLFASINGSSTQPFSGAAFDSTGPISGTTGTFSGVVSAAAAASGSTQVPQTQQVLGAGASAYINQTANRAINTPYTNSTGRPLWVVLYVVFGSVASGQVAEIQAYIGNNIFDFPQVPNTTAGAIQIDLVAKLLVPPGQTYQFFMSGYTGYTWYEY